ncbi:MAG: c-type cytochrome domain-containing protein [Maribacter sp.]|uniref:c-type cytochrome domain-containing protein n=1 Tax=Maribacter sp. TaxID=1897614 RepID=UPI003297B25F
MDVLKQLLGRLHPIIVHLPIGFIILGLLLQWYDRKRNEFNHAIPLIFLWAGYFAVLACISGYAQYIGEGYTFETVKWHLWLGIATAIFSFLMYFKVGSTKKFAWVKPIPIIVMTLLMFILISVTGHLGGTITHGEDYLVAPLPNTIKSALGFETFEEKEITLTEETWKEAQIYEDIIKPILNNKCISCHSPKKSKGELMLHNEKAILKGGENGVVLAMNNANASELFRRIDLPKTDEDHMPPKDKTQPSKEEIKLIRAWIDMGHPFNQTISQAGLEKELVLPFFPKQPDNNYPDIEVAEAAQDSVKIIEAKGIHVDPIDKTSNFLKVSCINKPNFTDADFAILKPIATQIAILDLGATQVTDAIFEKLVTLSNLTILKLDNTAISGKNISLLASKEYLKSINMTSTDFEETHVQELENFKRLKKVYLYKTKVNAQGTKTLKDGQITVYYGNYELPQIAADSIIY